MRLNCLALFIVCSGLCGMGCSNTSKPEKTGNSTVASKRDNTSVDPAISNTEARPSNPRDRKPRPDVNPGATPDPPKFRDAPENSQSVTTMNNDGSIQETRIFKSHPQLAKVEATWFEPTDKTLKIYLKNGTVVDAKTTNAASLQSVSSAEIMEVAGIKATVKAGDRPRIAGKK